MNEAIEDGEAPALNLDDLLASASAKPIVPLSAAPSPPKPLLFKPKPSDDNVNKLYSVEDFEKPTPIVVKKRDLDASSSSSISNGGDDDEHGADDNDDDNENEELNNALKHIDRSKLKLLWVNKLNFKQVFSSLSKEELDAKWKKMGLLARDCYTPKHFALKVLKMSADEFAKHESKKKKEVEKKKKKKNAEGEEKTSAAAAATASSSSLSATSVSSNKSNIKKKKKKLYSDDDENDDANDEDRAFIVDDDDLEALQPAMKKTKKLPPISVKSFDFVDDEDLFDVDDIDVDDDDDDGAAKKLKELAKKKKNKGSAASSSSAAASVAPAAAAKVTTKSSSDFGKRSNILKGVVICVSGIGNPDRTYIRELAMHHGSSYRPQWEAACTHLICSQDTSTDKFKNAKAAGAFIVDAQWIEDCVENRYRMPECDYEVKEEEEEEEEDDEDLHEDTTTDGDGSSDHDDDDDYS